VAPKIVLTADRTLMSPYRGISLASFLGCFPALEQNNNNGGSGGNGANSFWYYMTGSRSLSRRVFRNQVTPMPLFNFLCNPIAQAAGRATYAPYGLRKVEAALLKDGYSADDVAVVHPDHVEEFIGPGTEAVGVYEMDPLGMGPVSMTFTYGRHLMSYTEYCSRELHSRINAAKARNSSKAKVVVGASGTWQYNYDPAKIEEYGIYAVLEGELGGMAPEIDGAAGPFFDALVGGEFDMANPFKKSQFKVEIKEFLRGKKTHHGRFVHYWGEPAVNDIPDIVNPSMHGMIEVMRGCGRGCKFCDVTLRPLRYYPVEKVQKEIEVNMKYGGLKNAWIHSDDIFVYGMNPRSNKNMLPNREAIEELFRGVMATGVEHTNPTHGTLAGAIADERLIPNVSRIINAGHDNFIGIQCGLETGSKRLIGKYADRKLAPYKPEEWHWVVKTAVKTLNENYWIPAFSLIMGLDNDETPDDSWETIRLIHELESEQEGSKFAVAPLTFVPIGLLEKSDFYDIGSTMTAEQFGIIYKTWQHNYKHGMKKFMHQVGRNATAVNMFFAGLAVSMGWIPLAAMERYARKKGPDYERVIEKIKVSYA
jgi:radical SAM superfamily enzyme YgiQ (UPF0313 family)